MYVSVPKKIKVELSQLQSCGEIVSLFRRHGLDIAYFTNKGVSFYDATKKVKFKVPIQYFFKMSKKEFLILVEVVRRLDEAEKKVAQYKNLLSGE